MPPPGRPRARRGDAAEAVARAPCRADTRHATREPRGARESRATAARTSARSLQPLSAVSLSLGTRAVARAAAVAARARASAVARRSRVRGAAWWALHERLCSISLSQHIARGTRAYYRSWSNWHAARSRNCVAASRSSGVSSTSHRSQDSSGSAPLVSPGWS